MSDSPLWRPGRIGPMELKNRVIRSATNEHLSQPDGQLTAAWMDTLVELAENEVGLVITGHMSVDRQQRSDQGQTVLDEQTDLGLLYETARRVHQAGGRIVAQLNHGGKKSAGKRARPSSQAARRLLSGRAGPDCRKVPLCRHAVPPCRL